MKGKTLKERIKDHFNSKDWDYKFTWGIEKEKWGAKYETIKTLARLFDCPYTSLYLPIKELHSEGFLSYQHKLISTESKLLNNDQNAQVSDTTEAQ